MPNFAQMIFIFIHVESEIEREQWWKIHSHAQLKSHKYFNMRKICVRINHKRSYAGMQW
jgi:hypothetical protein